MQKCLFCTSAGPFSTVEHIIPESLGNDDLLLMGQVCDACQSYFGKEVEQFVLNKTPIGFWRTFFRIKTKKGHDPSIDMSQPKKQKGVFPAVHPAHDNIGFTAHDDGSLSVEISESSLVQKIRGGQKTAFHCVATPKVLHMLGRFLCKVGLELICSQQPDKAKSNDLLSARRYARFGEFDGLWPIFHFTRGAPNDFTSVREEAGHLVEDVCCYTYAVLEIDEAYTLFHFSMGSDNWVISLNDPFPSPIICGAFPDCDLKLIWYGHSEWKKNN